MGDGIENAARIAAQMDHERGGFAFGAWMAEVTQWGARTVLDHRPCGKLTQDKDHVSADGNVVPVIICPVHGRIEGPEAPPL